MGNGFVVQIMRVDGAGSVELWHSVNLDDAVDFAFLQSKIEKIKLERGMGK